MDVLVKSFFRPYYLARCLHSLEQFMKGSYRVHVLDDGTPERYLEKIRAMFPDVSITRSGRHAHKSAAIERHVTRGEAFGAHALPVDMWTRAVQACSTHFLMLEEDSWLVGEMEADALLRYADDQRVACLKLGWNNNPRVGGRTENKAGSLFQLITERPMVTHPTVARMMLTNRWVRAATARLGGPLERARLSFYPLYSVSSAIFDRLYWLYVWHNAPDHVNENAQLLRALAWLRAHPESQYARLSQERVHTSFITTSYGRLRLYPFDMLRLNHWLNEAWLAGRLDARAGLPGDFDVAALKEIVAAAGDPRCRVEDWEAWMAHFRALHRAVGSEV